MLLLLIMAMYLKQVTGTHSTALLAIGKYQDANQPAESVDKK